MTFDSMLNDVERYYTGKFSEYGATAAGVDWNTPESQELRFDQLMRIADRDDAFSIVDYGCGYGALLAYLRLRGRHVRYAGFDLSEPMVEHARATYPDARFVTVDVGLEPADYAVASGIFNVRLSTPDGRWREYISQTIERLDSLGERGFAFNMLTSYADAHKMRPDLFYGDPTFFFDVCKRRYSRDVALLHDYGLWEWTMLVRK
jgi:SAM-dependent methyltransferase